MALKGWTSDARVHELTSSAVSCIPSTCIVRGGSMWLDRQEFVCVGSLGFCGCKVVYILGRWERRKRPMGARGDGRG